MASKAPFPSLMLQRHGPDPFVGRHVAGKGVRWHCSASGNTAPDCRFDGDRCLAAKGYQIGIVSHVSSPAQDGVLKIEEWTSFALNWSIPEASDHNLWRIMIGDPHYDGSIGAPHFVKRVFEDVIHDHCKSKMTLDVASAIDTEVESLSRKYLRLAEGVVWNRRLIQAGEWLGLAPSESKVGDVIYVLRGCSVPVVLRENEPKQAKEVLRRRFRGSMTINHEMTAHDLWLNQLSARSLHS